MGVDHKRPVKATRRPVKATRRPVKGPRPHNFGIPKTPLYWAPIKTKKKQLHELYALHELKAGSNRIISDIDAGELNASNGVLSSIIDG
jgi:hypothetical protein